MTADAMEYVDVVLRSVFHMLREHGMLETVHQLEGLTEVGLRLQCAQAVDDVLEKDLCAAHEAGENGEDIKKRPVPYWPAVTVDEYGGSAYGAKNTPRSKGRTEKTDGKRAKSRSH